MAARFPLIANSSAAQIQELASGDDLDLTGSSITGAGIITATTFSGGGGSLTGISTGVSINASGGANERVVLSNTTAGVANTMATSGSLYWNNSTSTLYATNVNVSGTMTTEDTANLDATGIVTGGLGLRATKGGVHVLAGVSTFAAALDVNSTSDFGANLVVSVGGANITGGLTADQIKVTGVSTVQLATASTITGSNGVASIGATHYFEVSTNGSERLRVTRTGGLSLNNGTLVERANVSATAFNSDTEIDLDDGMIHYRSSGVGAANVKPNVVSSTGIATEMATGDAIAVTLITVAANTGHFIDAITIDHNDVTESWVGGSAPTDGSGSGIDTYSFNIIKTGAAASGIGTFVVVANQVKGS